MTTRQDTFLSALFPRASVENVAPSQPTARDPNYYNVGAAVHRGNGVSVEDELFQDARTMNGDELMAKYGQEEGMRIVRARAGGMANFQRDLQAPRSDLRMGTDTATGVASGFLGGLGSIAALGTGLVNEDAGTAVSGWVNNGLEWGRSTQSDALNARRRASAAQAELSSLDNQARYEQERETDGEAVATLRRLGRNFLDQAEITASDPLIMGDSAAQGVGSLLGGGVVGGGLKAAGRAALSRFGAGRAAAVAIASPRTFDTAVRVGQLADRARMPLAIGALEGGGAYTGTVDQIMSMTPEELSAGSELYRELIAQGVSHERARARVANAGGLTAAAIQAPIGVATGALVSRFEANPFRVGSAVTGASNIARETLEEGIQSGAGEFAQNLGIRAFADSDYDLAQGVGESAAEGAIAGAGTAGVFAGPSAAVGTMQEGARATGQMVQKALADTRARGEAINNRDAVSTPEQTAEAVRAAAAPVEPVINENIDLDQDRRELEQHNDVLESLNEQFRFRPEEYTPQNETEAALIAEMQDENPDIFTAMTAAARKIDDENLSDEQKLDLAFFIDGLQSRVTGENLGQVFQLQSTVTPGGTIAAEAAKIIAAQEMIETHEGFNKAIASVLEASPEVSVDELQDISTPEGQRAAQKAALWATVSPETIPEEVVERLLRHSENSPELFSRGQVIALRSTAALNQTLKQATAEAEAMGLKAPEAVRVSREAQIADPNDPGSAGPSVAGHYARVTGMLRRGEQENAAALLQEFQNFAQHYANKIKAVNESFARRDGDQQGWNPKVGYQAYNHNTQSWYNETWQTNRFDPKLKSQSMSQQVGVDGEYVINAFNALAQQYPALGVAPVEVARLDDALRVPARKVFENAKRQDFAEKNPDIVKPDAQADTKPTKTKAEPAQQPDKEPAPAPEVKSSEERLYDPEKIKQGTDKQIINEIEKLENRALFGTPLATDAANLKILRAERDRREEALASEPSVVVEDTTVPPSKTTKAAEEVAEPEAKPEVTATEEAAPVERQTPSMKEVFPNLVTSTEGENLFVDGYTLDNESRTRFMGEAPLGTNTVVEALLDADKFAQVSGLNASKITPDVSQAYAKTIQLVAGEVFSKISERLSKSKDFARHMKGQPVGPKGEKLGINLVGLRLINLMERQQDGSLAFNSLIQEASMLALSDWLAQNSMSSPARDKEDVAKALGVDIADVTDEVQAAFNGGISSARAHLGLMQKLEQFLGLKPNADTPLGQSRGVVLSLAGELLSSALATGVIKSEPVTIGDQHFNFFSVDKDKLGLAKHDQEGAKFGGQIALIQQIIMQDASEAGYTVGKPSRRQSQTLQGGGAPTTQEQRDTQVRENEVGHSINKPMLDIYRHLKGDGLLRLFGNGTVLPDTMNKNDKLSKEGQNLAIIAAYETIMSLAQEMEGFAGLTEAQLEDVKLHYEYDFTSVNRMQQQGSYGSQSSKLTREVITPYGETHDFTDPTSEVFSMWRRGLAQALGVKIELLSDAAWDAQLTDRLADPAVQTAISKIQGYENTTPDELVDALKAAKIDSAVALHALKSYADYLMAQEAGTLNEFRTHVYVEADGKTDGPTNSLFYMRLGGFDADLVRALARGGIQFSERAISLPEYYAANEGDAYQVAASKTAELRAQMADDIFNGAQNKEERAKLEAHSEAVDTVLNTLLSNKDFEIVRDGNKTTYIIGRNQLKNPMTVTVYGSSPDGIAKKIAKELVGLFYERVSEANAAAQEAGLPKEAWAGLLFNGDTETITKFGAALALLTSRQVGKGKDGFYVRDTKGGGLPARGGDAVNYTISPVAVRSLASALETFYVAPMVKAIEGEMGSSVGGSKLIQESTNMLSVFARAAFNRLMTIELEKTKLSDGLSPNQMKTIMNKVAFLFPYMEGDVITVNVRGLEMGTPTILNPETGKPRAVKSSASLSNELATQLEVPMPAIAGVAGAAYVNISYGDGRMIIKASPGLTGGRLHIFDGINNALSSAKENGVVINTAVIEAMQTGTPFQDLLNTFKELTTSLNMDIFSEQEMLSMYKNIAGPRATPEKSATLEVQQELGRLSVELQDAVLQEKARQAVFARVHISSDHMAALNAPASTAGQDGREDLSSLSFEGIAARLQELYTEELAKLQKEAVTERANPASEKITPAFKGLNAHSTGVRITSTDQLADLLDALKLPAQQAQMIRRALSSLSAPWKVVIGNMKQANAYAQEQGINHKFKTGDYGLAAPERRTLIVANGSAETLAHELIHAATFERIDAYMIDPMQMDPQSRQAIGRLDALMNEWLAVVDDQVMLRQESARKAVNNAKRAINNALDQGDRAAALNEFMAWNLSNQELMKLNSTIKVESTLARIARDVLRVLRSMFGLPSNGSDMNSNIRFNTMLLMSKRLPTPQSVAASRLLMHSTHTRPDLDRMRAVFASLLRRADMGYTKWLGSKPSQLAAGVAKAAADIVVQNGFDLTEEEKRTFTVMLAAFRVNMVKDPAFAMKLHRYHRELSAQMNQSNMALGDPNDPGENTKARARIELLKGSVDLGNDVAGSSLLVPAFAALGAVSPDARKLFNNIQVRAQKKGAKPETLDEAVVKVTDEALNTINDYTLGVRANQKVGDAVNQLVASFVEEADREKSQLQAGLEVPGRLIRGANQKVTEAVSFGLGKTTDAIDQVLNRTTEGTLANKALTTAKVAVQLFDKKQVEEGVDQVMSWADTAEIHPELRSVIVELAGSNETNQDVFILIKQGRAVIDRVRETYRQGVPKQIMNKFTRPLTKEEWEHVHVLGQMDMPSLLGQGLTDGDVVDLLSDPAAMKTMEGQKTADIRRLFGANAPAILGDAADLASLMVNKKPAHGLVKRNALAIANRVGEANVGSFTQDSPEVRAVDAYVSLLAMSQVAPSVLKSLGELSTTQKTGLRYTLSMMAKARANEMKRITDRQRFNVLKGYMPQEQQGSFKAVPVDKVAGYTKAGYRIVGSRKQSAAEALYDARAKNMVYVATDLTAPAFKQGIMRTVRSTVFGLDANSGASFDTPSAGLITDVSAVKAMTRALQKKSTNDASVRPLYNEQGQIYAYERLVDPTDVNNAIETQQNAAVALGQWMGRQHEEIHGARINEVLLDRLTDMWTRANNQSRTNEFVDLFELAKTDPVIADALRLMPDDMKSRVMARMDGKFMVRRTMYDNVIGFRSMSIGDLWTGNTRLKEENREALVNTITGLIGPKAYRYLTMGEQAWSNLMGDARVAIVVKSVLVPVLNATANFYQLMANGIGPIQIAQKTAEYLRETHLYAKNQMEYQRLSVELAAAEGAQRPDNARRIETEMRKIEDLNRQLAIYPLIEAGEFSQITEGLSHDDLEMSNGRIWDRLEKLADKLPPAVKTAGRYALVTKDTALFAGLARAVAYTDFVAKAVLYDHLSTKEKLDKKTALLRITNEFVNYDILDGRMKSKAEEMGLIWFWRFKIRSIKVAASLIRNNPLHTFLSSMVPGSMEAGTVMDDNGFNLFLDGRMDNSIGFDNAWRAVELNPVNQVFS